MPYRDYYVPVRGAIATPKADNPHFKECFSPMGDNSTCVRYEVKCRYCKHFALTTGMGAYRSVCLRTQWKLKHTGKNFLVCDFFEANHTCIEKCEREIEKNRIGIGGFVGLSLKR